MNMMLERSNWISKQKDHGSSYKSVKYSNSGDLSVGPGGAPSATPGCSSCQCGTGASATTAAKELQQPHDHSCFTDYVWSVQKIGGFRIFGSSLRHHPSSPQLKVQRGGGGVLCSKVYLLATSPSPTHLQMKIENICYILIQLVHTIVVSNRRFRTFKLLFFLLAMKPT
ncbi:uncharacterized protein [Triticum aestivum]|uniref:uncharacterized protein isoform X6 n=1 Tax=Triticum aestivum TaxID=4565 RepID=UPI001D010839|nr:uncharacterized protein LOC123182187 isoform X6 [Triticum aestivum]